jgi:flagellar hook capping protein FlgD
VPRAPRVRVTIDDQACLGRPCRMMPVPWRASVMLPPLPPLGYQLPLEVARVSCRDSYPPGELFVGGFPFVVADSCAARVGCILPSFVPGGSPRACDARIALDHPAHIALHLRTSVPLTLLQGELAIGDTALRIAALKKTDVTERFFLRWSRTPRGARFTLVADPAATIPATDPAAPAPAVLGIDLEVAPDHEPPPVTLLTMNELVAFDAESMREVPWCPTLFANALRYAAYARICSGPAPRCDVNGDGRADIRDLVLMLRCLRDGSLCGDPPARFDCNQDQVFSIDDVTCCAESILAQDCPGCPPGDARDTRDVKVSLGPPVGRIGALDVPVRIEGAGAIGGARLALRYPDERYEVTRVDFGGAAANWLQLSQVRDGRVLIGLLDPDAPPESQARAVVTVHFELRPGREPGGDLSLESADFSARDGVRLAAHVPVLRQPLGSRLALSESRPNPFAAATRFEVSVERPGPVEVAIFDLSGRKLYTVHHGDLPAGTHEFAWDGRLADGSRASDGVYFYRVDAGNETVARKLVLLRSEAR